MPLYLAPTNVPMTIVRIVTDEKTKKHLESLGITLKSHITVISSNNGAVIALVKDGRLALDRNISGKIMVA